MNTNQKINLYSLSEGMKDHLPSEQERYRQIQNICTHTAQCFHYQEISHPFD